MLRKKSASMAYSKPTKIVLNNLCISPKTGITFTGQLEDCYRQISEGIGSNAFIKASIVKQTIFISAENNPEYIKRKNELLECSSVFFGKLPPTSIVPQTPENGTLAIELIILEGFQSDEISHRYNDNFSWIVFQRGKTKILFASCSSETTSESNILLQSQTAFSHLQHILAEEKMEFSDIIRQWNYIEQITKNVTHNNSVSQHYQIFNDVRTKYYQQADFKNGFPSATGIGMDCAGIIIEAIAARFENDYSVIAIKSPVQLDAYTYSKEVLAENNTMSDFCRTTPKFERAKIIVSPGNNWVFISGTAAIKGQISIPVLSVELQTEMTIQNILSLISNENLHKHGIESNEKASIKHLRVYVKYNTDISPVKSICRKYFPDIPVIYVVADICRPELLVEIEGFAILN
jgi:enamine deaminase RidA (YjgF/YER057c/UK114 family)